MRDISPSAAVDFNAMTPRSEFREKVRRVGVPVQVDLEGAVDADDAEAGDEFRPVRDARRAEHDRLLVPFDVVE